MKVFKKIKNRIKEFGYIGSFKRFFYVLVRPIVRIKTNIVLAIPNHISKNKFDKTKLLNKNKINLLLKNGEINLDQANRFIRFLESNCYGFYNEKEEKLAAWGFIQNKGKYQYGMEEYQIPKEIYILKNLFVLPEYRGKSLGKFINTARINSIPNGCLPVGFVIPENRYALRNLKMLGFKEFILVEHAVWFNKWKRKKITVLQPGEIASKILKGFKK